jgi:hypothetical protein
MAMVIRRLRRLHRTEFKHGNNQIGAVLLPSRTARRSVHGDGRGQLSRIKEHALVIYPAVCSLHLPNLANL